MKFCFQCKRVTGGEPLFCSRCGCTYDVKLCPRQHANPRYAEVCSQCGSRDLSTPQPRVPVWGRALIAIVPWLAAIPLAMATLAIGVDAVYILLARPQFQASVASLAILIGLLWFLWSQSPEWIRKAIHHAISKRHREGGGRGRGGE